jgi:hypothetical protein
MSIRSGARRTVDSIELLIEVHTEDGDPVVGVYLGDGVSVGLDVTTETAERLVRRLGDALALTGAGLPAARQPAARQPAARQPPARQPSAAPKSRPSA